ncbi:ROK family transcriptional regulator [Oceanobacillus jordanicus]|uniref:ROK family transcriptional regulator n=1 Tax=Oceanobacillus jordanicus TaxID=2867266 RepID=A0AAW5B3W5_9BACI|nr:ROK family transcriptional regulator [Oceanobacillus jordanicus]MCG3418107.1 ROK family transcriptional regulator [Oceanobacillus jordanicus]
MQRGTFQLMKSVNKSIILNKVRTAEPISRAQIAKETKLTPPTVSSIVKELLEEGIIRESSLGESQGGRKPTMLHINLDAFYVIGVDAGPQRVTSILTDLAGNIIHRADKELFTPITNEQFMGVLKDTISETIEASNREKREMVGIGVAMHGVVNVETGTSLIAPNLNLKNIPIKEELEKEFELDVKVENDARAMALGESWFGGHGSASMVAVNIGHGVGAGLVINEKLYHGDRDIAGEIGHMTIDLHGPTCTCGNTGCLQAFVSGPAIAARAQKEGLTGEDIAKLAKSGDQEATSLLEETGKLIGIGLVNLIHLVNPEKIVLGGGVMKSEKFILPAIKETISARGLTQDAKETNVSVTKLGDHATLLGAVALLLVELFDPVG